MLLALPSFATVIVLVNGPPRIVGHQKLDDSGRNHYKNLTVAHSRKIESWLSVDHNAENLS